MLKVFISYSRKDEAFARKIAALLSEWEIQVWIDVDDIPVGANWSNAIAEGLDSCDILILILSPGAMASRNVADEWQWYHDHRKPIIPLFLHPTRLHFQLSRIQYIDFHTQSFEKASERLRAELQFVQERGTNWLEESQIRSESRSRGLRKVLLPLGVVTPMVFLVFLLLPFISSFSPSMDDVGVSEETCDGVHPVLLKSGRIGIVQNSLDSPVPVRTEPSLEAETIEQLLPGQTFRVLSELHCVQNLAWFRIDYGAEITGWINEGTELDSRFQYLVGTVGAAEEDNQEILPCTQEFFFTNGLGCPVGNTIEALSAIQEFERGKMIWRSQPDEFLVLFEDRRVDILHVSYVRTLLDNPITDAPPAGRIIPVSGFGRIWGNLTETRERLGWAVSPELGYQMRFQTVDVQTISTEDPIFQYMTLPDGRVIALLARNGEWHWRYVN